MPAVALTERLAIRATTANFEKYPTSLRRRNLEKNGKFKDIIKEKNLRTERSKGKAISTIFSTGHEIYLASDAAQELAKKYNFTDKQLRDGVVSLDFTFTKPLTEEREAIFIAASSARKIARQILREVLEGENDLSFSEVEKIIFKHGLNLADYYDDYHVDWMKEIPQNTVMSEAVKKHNGDRTAARKELLKESGQPDEVNNLTYTYYVFKRDEEGKVRTVPYTEIFKKHFDKIIPSYEAMLQDLIDYESGSGATEETTNFINYLTKLCKAIKNESGDLLEQEKLFVDAEFAWLKTMRASRTYFQHSMENGYFADTEVEAEFGLGIEDDREEEMNKLAKGTREKVITALFEKVFPKGTPENEALEQSRDAMTKTMTKIYARISSGRDLQRPPFAGNIPNRQVIRTAEGSHIFVDMEVFNQRDKQMRDILDILFGKDSKEAREYNDNNHEYRKLYAGGFLAGHEMFHNGFNFLDLEERLTPESFHKINELKADEGIYATAHYVFGDDKDRLIRFAKLSAYASLRFIKNFSKENMQYIYAANMFLNHMSDPNVEIIKRDENKKWIFDFTEEKVMKFFQMNEKRFVDIARLYISGNKAQTQDFLDTYCTESDLVKQLREAISNTPNNN